MKKRKQANQASNQPVNYSAASASPLDGAAERSDNASATARFFPWLVVLAGLAYILAAFQPQRAAGPFDLASFGRLPMLHEGRIKPLDTAARASLMLLSNKQTLRAPLADRPSQGRTISAVEWLLDVIARPELAENYPAFRIDHPDIKSLLGSQDPAKHSFSFKEIVAKAAELNEQMSRAFKVEEKERNLYQTKLLELSRKLQRYQELAGLEALVPVLNADAHAAVVPGQSLDSRVKASPALASFVAILKAYREERPGDFNATVASHRAAVQQQAPDLLARTNFEALFHRVEPFYIAMVLYVAIFLLAAFSWLGWSRPLGAAAMGLMTVTLLLHTLGLAVRVYLHGHPPVTNLYASSVFVGWACVVLALVIEWIFRNGIGSAMAGVVGFLTLLVAHNLSDGDNLEAVRAVLDTNLWLSTHVVVVTIGYASTFLAGFLAILYVVRGVLSTTLTSETARNLSRATYGILCFAVIASFIGTVLGGIWADQSWGRFWGWDPKENGALLIVMANALILHARWAQIVRDRGMAVLAIGGNIVTAWSWFGVNMLGVGLHSYGFMDKALGWMLIFIASQLILMAVGSLPMRYWRSFRNDLTEPATPIPVHAGK